ncbi:hypothetical protein B0H19DRAFT_1253517 [Mycena capillaripes]|nr:hypothetical protein B0H19DRAFT_1253517 [Mycena capillaripes]
MELLKDPEKTVRSTAANAVGSFAKHDIFHDSIKIHVAQMDELLKDDDRRVRQAAIDITVKLADLGTILNFCAKPTQC